LELQVPHTLTRLATTAGLSKTLEPKKTFFISPNDRPDLALRNQIGHFNTITDVRTAVPSLAPTCPGAAATPGHTAPALSP
jgi:hypothetical protein